MKIVSWNVNGIRAAAKKGLPEFIQTFKPDILCLQETKAHLDQVENEIKNLGYQYSYWSSAVKKGYSGVATFTNIEPLRIERGLGMDVYDSEGRIVVTEFSSFELFNIYFPNGGSGDERHNFKQKFLKDLSSLLQPKVASRKPVVVVGDYNVAYLDIDVHDPVRLSRESGFLPEEREWMKSFLKMGFVDSFRHFHPTDDKCYTWWDYRTMARIANRGWRIDHICVTDPLKEKLRAVKIFDDVMGSDHCPIMAEFSIP